MFAYDIETLGVESTAVLLSAAIVYFNPEDKPTYQYLLDNTLFVKFNAEEQISKYKRTIDKDTIEWWSKQPKYVQDKAFKPSPEDMSTVDGLELLRKYINRYPNPENQTMWVRGTLDQTVTESLCKAADVKPLIRYSNYRDVRTAIDILYGSTNGYVDIDHPEFDRDKVQKHLPYADVCLDAMMILYGKSKF